MLITYVDENHNCTFGNSNTINRNHINDLIRHASSAGIKKKIYSLLVVMYINADDFDAADMLFSTFIKPHISSFEKIDIESLILGISNNNQTHWRSRANTDHALIVDRADEVLDEFDVKKYTYLPQPSE